MKKLNITKEAFEKSQYFKNKYGTLKYVSESGRYFKTNKGQVLKFVESKKKKKMNEVSGWDLEDEDLTLVNSESDGDKLYIVKLWWGSGYMLDCYNAWAFSEEEALNYVVAYIEKTDPESLEAIDENANDYLQELVDEGEAASLEEAYENPYFQETYLWVDATTEGAEQGHYIYNENLQIAEYPAKHNHPLAKGVDRSKFTEGMDRRSFQDPITDEECEFAAWLEQCIEEEFGIPCSCEFHNPGEEQHIEIFIDEEGIEKLEEDFGGEMDVAAKLEEFVNEIGDDGDPGGERWGDANFNYNGDYIFGEIWPERLWTYKDEVTEGRKKFVDPIAKKIEDAIPVDDKDGFLYVRPDYRYGDGSYMAFYVPGSDLEIDDAADALEEAFPEYSIGTMDNGIILTPR